MLGKSGQPHRLCQEGLQAGDVAASLTRSVTSSWWPLSLNSPASAATSQIVMLVSREAEANNDESLLKQRAVMADLWLLRVAEQLGSAPSCQRRTCSIPRFADAVFLAGSR